MKEAEKEWYIEVDLGAEDITMVDTIPEGILTMKGCATNVKELGT